VICAGAVEHAVAQHETLDPRCARDPLLVLDDRRDEAADWRWCVSEQPRVLLLDAVARRRVRERDALRHNAACAGGKRCIDEDPGALGPHAVVRVEQVGIAPVEPRRQRRELVDDRFGRGVGHARPNPLGVEHVADDRVGASRLELRSPQYRAGHRRYLVPRLQ
jgi:hypothetical protein